MTAVILKVLMNIAGKLKKRGITPFLYVMVLIVERA